MFFSFLRPPRSCLVQLVIRNKKALKIDRKFLFDVDVAVVVAQPFFVIDVARLVGLEFSKAFVFKSKMRMLLYHLGNL